MSDPTMQGRLEASKLGEWVADPEECPPDDCGTQVMRYDEDAMIVFAEDEVARALAIAEQEKQALRQELLALGTPYPVHSMLAKLADAADILLREKDYDGHGHEEIGCARDAARAYLAKAAPDNDGCGPVNPNESGEGYMGNGLSHVAPEPSKPEDRAERTVWAEARTAEYAFSAHQFQTKMEAQEQAKWYGEFVQGRVPANVYRIHITATRDPDAEKGRP